jgi:hypothetical protein
MNATTDWMAEVKARGTACVAEALGWPMASRGKHRTVACPNCHVAPDLRNGDAHGADVTKLGLWLHASCGGKGSALDVLTVAIAGRPWQALDAEARDQVRLEAEARGFCSVRTGAPPARRAAIAFQPFKPRTPIIAAGREYPPLAEVEELWARSLAVTEHVEARIQLEARGIDPHSVEEHDLARGVPTGPLPAWAGRRFAPWSLTGHVVVVPLVDADGRMRSLHARHLTLKGGGKKALLPTGHKAGGLILADGLSRAVFSGDADALALVRRVGLDVFEGVPDFLAGACTYSDADDDAPAVVGLISGGWTGEHARRVPDGTTLRVQTHEDQGGREYALQMHGTFRARDVKFLVRFKKNSKAGEVAA